MNHNLRKHGQFRKHQKISNLARNLGLPDPSQWKLREYFPALFAGSPKVTFPFQKGNDKEKRRQRRTADNIGYSNPSQGTQNESNGNDEQTDGYPDESFED
jgi:hypothetical protein